MATSPDARAQPSWFEAMAVYFKPPYPARAAVGVSSLPRGAQVEIDAIMHIE